MSHILHIDNVSHWFGQKLVLGGVDLKVTAGEIVSLVGPSGCGKTTLLNTILGTHPPRKGETKVDGTPMLKPSRDVGIVYQNYDLYDFWTAKKNVAAGLMFDQTSLPHRIFKYFEWKKLQQEHWREAIGWLEKVGLGDAVESYPPEMSGGMRQRTAIAQSLIMRPKILLLDEPFASVDEATREDLQTMLLHFYQENLKAKAEGKPPGITIFIVTHELNEAIIVSNRVVGLSQYHQDGHKGARVVYDQPAPVFHPEDTRDITTFKKQKDELRKAVFDPDYLQHHEDFLHQWE